MNTFGVARKDYIDVLQRLINKPVIKVIVGMRRVGKSYLMRQLKQFLLTTQGVKEKNVIYIDKELFSFNFLKTYVDLNSYIRPFLKNKQEKYYLLIDEVQEIEGWEKAVASFHNEGLDIFLTGSNAHMLSSDLATLIAGRYTQIEVYALSYKEFLNFYNKPSSSQSLMEYLKLGGFPMLPAFSVDEKSCYNLVHDIFETILFKDIILRHNIRNVHLLQNIVFYMADNVAKTFSAKKIADYLKSQRLKLSVETVYEYLRYLTSTYTFHQIRRYDIKGKRHLEILEKYYLGDLALRHAFIGFREMDINAFLENIVYLELLRRGYKVSIGKIGDCEIDFIAEKQNEKIYFQVCYLLASDDVLKREIGALKSVSDNYPKVILSLDEIFGGSFEGIQWMNILEWLLLSNKETVFV